MQEKEKTLIRNLCESLSVSERFAELLVKRGFSDPESARRFLYPSRDEMVDPFTLTGMRQAVDRIRAAVEGGERIVVYGDYDCDGITATAILTDYLTKLGASVSYFIPSRFDTGYGLTIETLEEIAESEDAPDLIVTVDCGVSSVNEAEYLAEVLGIDLVVTDHHVLPDVLPATTVVNPRLDPDSPARDLCGAGVALKLVEALGGRDAAWKYIEIAAIGTIADVVPLTGENRLIVSLGLGKIRSRETINKGLRLLMETVGCKRESMTATDVGFRISPCINALGRLEACREVVTLFTSDEYVELQGLIEKLVRVNELRKSLVVREEREALQLIKDYDLAANKLILLADPSWNPGILGLVAGRLKDRFSRTVILLTGEEELHGSARSPEGVDMVGALKSAGDLLVKYGGHSRAAGLTVARDKVIAARDRINDYLEKTYSNDVYSRKEHFDLELAPEEVTVDFARELALFEPTGAGNPKPTFRFFVDPLHLPLSKVGSIVKTKLNREAEIVAFSQFAYLPDAIGAGFGFDLICDCSENLYNNRVTAQMCVRQVFPKSSALNAVDPVLFNAYLRSNCFKEESCSVNSVTAEELSMTLYDDDFCTQFITFSEGGASRVFGDQELTDKVKRFAYRVNDDAPLNQVIFHPEDDAHIGYKRLVLLDTPLSTGYAARLVKNTGAELFVLKDNYPFVEIFRSADLGYPALEKTYQRIRSFVFSGDAVATPLDLMRKLEPNDLGFLIRFYMLYQCGAILIGQGFALSPQSFKDPFDSTLYRRILSLRNRG